MSKDRPAREPGARLMCNRYLRPPREVEVLCLLFDRDRHGGRIYQVRDLEDGREWPCAEEHLYRARG